MVEQAEAPVASTRRRYRRPILLFLLLLLSLAAAGLYTSTLVLVRVDNVILPGVDVALPLPMKKALPGLTSAPAEGSPGFARVNILILGIDRRPHHNPNLSGPPNADSVHLLSLDPISRTGTLLAVPRDLYLEIPSPEKEGEFWESRINATYRLGEEFKYPGGGAGFVRRVIDYNFHIPIDYHVVVDWMGFATVIDALGGIWIEVPEELRDVEAINPRDGHSFKITITPGWHYMDAITALAYARFRDDPESDFGRMRRQHQVMRAAADEALRTGWLAQGPQLYQRFRDAVDTDLSMAKLPGILNLGRIIGLERVTTLSLAGERAQAVRRVITPWGEDVLVPIWEEMAPIARTVVDDRPLRAEAATVTVVNATGIRGQDARAAAFLARFALLPEQISTAATRPPGPPSATTTISYSGNASETAQRVADWLGVPASRISRGDDPPDAPPSVTVTLGTDVRLPEDERFHRYLRR